MLEEPTAVEAAYAKVLLATAIFTALLFALYNWRETTKDEPKLSGSDVERQSLIGARGVSGSVMASVIKIKDAIAKGAYSFLMEEYKFMLIFVILFSSFLYVLITLRRSRTLAAYSALSYLAGAFTSIFAGFMGMKIAVRANYKVAIAADEDLGSAFRTAYKAALVMGFNLVGCALLVLFGLVEIYRKLYFTNSLESIFTSTRLFECISGFGLGASTIALFGRVGGGIYTKAADVGADLSGKIEHHLPEDDPRNPAVIADNVGDNVGDIAGMGADLFGSFASSTVAALLLSTQSSALQTSEAAILFPLLISALGAIVCFFVAFLATHFLRVRTGNEIEPMLKRQLLISSIILTPLLYWLSITFLPSQFTFEYGVWFDQTPEGETRYITSTEVFYCVALGLWTGLLIGYQTDYYTSHSHPPVRELAGSSRTGAATNIIYGLALGYQSVVFPVFLVALTIFASFSLCGMYGLAVSALGMLSTLAIELSIDAYGPICDNAGGIAEMAGMGAHVRERTDDLDAAGNTTAAIGKGFAIGSAAFVALSLFGAYVTLVNLKEANILEPLEFSGLLVGSMLPYWFSAMTMKSVGHAAFAMVEEVRRQFKEEPRILTGEVDPDYARCVSISTKASLKEMIAPGFLVVFTPVFGTYQYVLL